MCPCAGMLKVQGGMRMDLQVEYGFETVQVIVRGPQGNEEMERIIALLQGGSDKLWALDEERRTVAISPGTILWAETVEDKTFVYTRGAMYQAECSLTALELRWEGAGLFRCGKSVVVNLNAVCSLRSQPGGRIEAVLESGERIVISRRYTPALREKLLKG